jgi:hypothetical protein
MENTMNDNDNDLLDEEETMDAPDYDTITDLKEVDQLVRAAKDAICRKVKQQAQLKDAKKEMAGSYNEQIKHLQEQIDHELGIVDGLTQRKLVLEMGVTN